MKSQDSIWTLPAVPFDCFLCMKDLGPVLDCFGLSQSISLISNQVSIMELQNNNKEEKNKDWNLKITLIIFHGSSSYKTSSVL